MWIIIVIKSLNVIKLDILPIYFSYYGAQRLSSSSQQCWNNDLCHIQVKHCIVSTLSTLALWSMHALNYYMLVSCPKFFKFSVALKQRLCKSNVDVNVSNMFLKDKTNSGVSKASSLPLFSGLGPGPNLPAEGEEISEGHLQFRTRWACLFLNLSRLNVL